MVMNLGDQKADLKVRPRARKLVVVKDDRKDYSSAG
jgi:hypothetical protein